jgi:hypothetical protein
MFSDEQKQILMTSGFDDIIGIMDRKANNIYIEKHFN